jgi:integrase
VGRALTADCAASRRAGPEAEQVPHRGVVLHGHVQVQGRDAHVAVPKVDSKGLKYNRVIWLTPAAEFIVRRLAAKWPEGKLFRNNWGRPWSTGRLNERCTALKLDFPFFPYALRHTWITEALERGVDPVTLAILAGHRDTTMICRVYQHLARVPGHLKASLLKATGGEVAAKAG